MPSSPRDTEGDDDLDEMLHQIELDQARGGGLPWSDSADSAVLLPPADSYSPPPRPHHITDDKPIVLPGAMQDRRIVTKTLGGSHGPPSMNPLAAASASRLLDHARGATFTPVPGQDPRIRTQYFPPTAVAGQDYRVQTHAFPQGLLEGKGISLREGGQSAAAENDSLMRAIQEKARASDKGRGGLPVLLEGEMHAGGGDAGAGGAPSYDDWDSTSASESMTGSELSQTIGSDSAVSSLTSSSQAVSSVSDSARTSSANAGTASGGAGSAAGIGSGQGKLGVANSDANTKQRNREAAKDYRRRKKEYMRQLQADVERLQQEKADLAKQCTTLQTENTMLRGLVSAPRVGDMAVPPYVGVPVVDHGYAQHHHQQQLYQQQLQAQAQAQAQYALL